MQQIKTNIVLIVGKNVHRSVPSAISSKELLALGKQSTSTAFFYPENSVKDRGSNSIQETFEGMVGDESTFTVITTCDVDIVNYIFMLDLISTRKNGLSFAEELAKKHKTFDVLGLRVYVPKDNKQQVNQLSDLVEVIKEEPFKHPLINNAVTPASILHSAVQYVYQQKQSYLDGLPRKLSTLILSEDDKLSEEEKLQQINVELVTSVMNVIDYTISDHDLTISDDKVTEFNDKLKELLEGLVKP